MNIPYYQKWNIFFHFIFHIDLFVINLNIKFWIY